MATQTSLIDQKLDNIQGQLDVIRREASSFRAYANTQFRVMFETMATKDDLYRLEARIEVKMDAKFATKEDLSNMEARMNERFASKEDLTILTAIVIKIAQKVGVDI